MLGARQTRGHAPRTGLATFAHRCVSELPAPASTWLHLMATITTTRRLTPAELATLRSARNDVVIAERAVDAGGPGEPGRAEFACDDGPFSRYRRRLSWTDPALGEDEVHAVTEQIEYRIAVPYFGPLFTLLTRRDVRARPDRIPWWSPPTRIDERSARVLGIGCALAVVVGFLGGLITQTMTFIVADLGGTLTDQTNVLSLTRIGALATIGVGLLGDRRGRRPLIAVGLLGAAAASLLTAAATSLVWVAVDQTISRGLVAGAGVLVAVLVLEEMPAAARAYATGLLAMSAGLGVGVVLWVLKLADLSRGSWRLIYLLSLPFAALTLHAVRRLPESHRFTTVALRPDSVDRSRISTRRLLILGLVFVLLNIFVGPAQQLQNEYLRTVRGFSGGRITAFLLLTNTWGGIGIIAGGRAADRRSRRLVASVGLAGLALGNAAMFAGGGWPMWAWSVVGSILGAATTPALGVLGPELFPTARRGTGSGLITVAAVIGSVIGLQSAGALIDRIGYGWTFLALGAGPMAIIGLLRGLPDTARIELEALNEDAGSNGAGTADGYGRSP